MTFCWSTVDSRVRPWTTVYRAQTSYGLSRLFLACFGGVTGQRDDGKLQTGQWRRSTNFSSIFLSHSTCPRWLVDIDSNGCLSVLRSERIDGNFRLRSPRRRSRQPPVVRKPQTNSRFESHRLRFRHLPPLVPVLKSQNLLDPGDGQTLP